MTSVFVSLFFVLANENNTLKQRFLQYNKLKLLCIFWKLKIDFNTL